MSNPRETGARRKTRDSGISVQGQRDSSSGDSSPELSRTLAGVQEEEEMAPPTLSAAEQAAQDDAEARRVAQRHQQDLLDAQQEIQALRAQVAAQQARIQNPGVGGAAGSATEVRHLRESTLERVRMFVNHLGDAYATMMRYWMSMFNLILSIMYLLRAFPVPVV